MKTFDFSKFKSLKQLLQTFKTEADCIHFLEDKLWDEKVPTSPYDPTSKVYRRGDGYYRLKTQERISASERVRLWKALTFH